MAFTEFTKSVLESISVPSRSNTNARTFPFFMLSIVSCLPRGQPRSGVFSSGVFGARNRSCIATRNSRLYFPISAFPLSSRTLLGCALIKIPFGRFHGFGSALSRLPLQPRCRAVRTRAYAAVRQNLARDAGAILFRRCPQPHCHRKGARLSERQRAKQRLHARGCQPQLLDRRACHPAGARSGLLFLRTGVHHARHFCPAHSSRLHRSRPPGRLFRKRDFPPRIHVVRAQSR